jgi:hypothetical protein
MRNGVTPRDALLTQAPMKSSTPAQQPPSKMVLMSSGVIR